MTEQKNILAQLFAACWKDEALKARLMADPKAVLKDHGLNVPDGIDVKALQDDDCTLHIVLPVKPSDDLSDEALEAAAGGGIGQDSFNPDILCSGSQINVGFIRSMAS